MTPEEELNEFVAKVSEFANSVCPKWLTPNSNFVGVVPGHNLDLLQVAFDFRVERWWLLAHNFETPDSLKDPSGPPTLKAVK